MDKWGAQYIGSRVSPGCYFYYSLLLDGLCVWLKFTNVSLKFISLSEVKKNILYFSATVGMLFHCMSLYQLGIKNKDYMVYPHRDTTLLCTVRFKEQLQCSVR